MKLPAPQLGEGLVVRQPAACALTARFLATVDRIDGLWTDFRPVRLPVDASRPLFGGCGWCVGHRVAPACSSGEPATGSAKLGFATLTPTDPGQFMSCSPASTAARPLARTAG